MLRVAVRSPCLAAWRCTCRRQTRQARYRRSRPRVPLRYVRASGKRRRLRPDCRGASCRRPGWDDPVPTVPWHWPNRTYWDAGSTREDHPAVAWPDPDWNIGVSKTEWTQLVRGQKQCLAKIQTELPPPPVTTGGSQKPESQSRECHSWAGWHSYCPRTISRWYCWKGELQVS